MQKCNITLAEKISRKQMSKADLTAVTTQLEKHLKNPWGTLENFPRKASVELIAEHYPDLIDLQAIKEHTEEKVNSYMGNIADNIYENVRVNNDTRLISMLINNFMRGKEEDNSPKNAVAFQINFNVEPEGKLVTAECKRPSIASSDT